MSVQVQVELIKSQVQMHLTLQVHFELIEGGEEKYQVNHRRGSYSSQVWKRQESWQGRDERGLDVDERDWMEMRGDWMEIRGDWMTMRGDWMEMRGDWMEMRGDWMEMRGDW